MKSPLFTRPPKASAVPWTAFAISLADAVLVFVPWLALILVSEFAGHVNGVAALAILSASALAARYWFAGGDNPEGRKSAEIFSISAMLLLVFGAAWLASVQMTALLFLFAFATWLALSLRSYWNGLSTAMDAHGLTLDNKISGTLARFLKSVSLISPDRPWVLARHRAQERVLFDAACLIPAFGAVLIWPQAPHVLAVILFALAASTIWGQLDRLASLFQGEALTRAASSDSNLEYSAEANADFTSVSLTGLSNKTVRDFNSEIMGGLCLAMVGSGGSGKTQFLRDLASGRLYGSLTFRSTSPVAPKTLEQLFGYCAPNADWVEGSIESVLSHGTHDHGKAYRILASLDPFGEVFADIDGFNQNLTSVTPLQSKLLSLAKCLSSHAPILILNGPEMHLDQVSRAAFLACALKAKIDGKVLLVATEDDMIMSMSDELVMLDRGEIADRGPMYEVRKRHRDKFLRASFLPTVEDAYRLALWLENIMPSDVDHMLAQRVIKTAEELLLQTPRDAFASQNAIIFDTKLGAHECFLTMLDRGDVLGLDATEAGQDAEHDFYLRVLPNARLLADSFGETQRHGYRQISMVFRRRDEVRVSDDVGHANTPLSATA